MAPSPESARHIVAELVSQGWTVTEVRCPSRSLRMLATSDETKLELVFICESSPDDGTRLLTNEQKLEILQLRRTVAHDRAQVVFVSDCNPSTTHWQLL